MNKVSYTFACAKPLADTNAAREEYKKMFRCRWTTLCVCYDYNRQTGVVYVFGGEHVYPAMEFSCPP